MSFLFIDHRPWWWNDPETKAWIASGACCCPSCKQGRKLIEESSGESDG